MFVSPIISLLVICVVLYCVSSDNMEDRRDVMSMLTNIDGKYYTVNTQGLHMPTISRSYMVVLKDHKKELEAFRQAFPYDMSTVQIFEAIDGKKVDITQENITRHIRKMHAFDGFWNTGVLGCALSHEALWHLIASDQTLRENDRVMIFEEGARFPETFKLLWEEASKEFPSNMEHVWMGGRFTPDYMPSKRALKTFHRVGKHAYSSGYGDRGTFAYLITKKGAKRFIARIDQTDGIYRAVDHFMTDYISENVPSTWSYSMLPLPIWHPLDDDSTIRKGPTYAVKQKLHLDKIEHAYRQKKIKKLTNM